MLAGRAAESYVLASIEKLGTVAPYRVRREKSDVTGIISDAPADHPVINQLRNRGANIVIVDAGRHRGAVEARINQRPRAQPFRQVNPLWVVGVVASAVMAFAAVEATGRRAAQTLAVAGDLVAKRAAGQHLARSGHHFARRSPADFAPTFQRRRGAAQAIAPDGHPIDLKVDVPLLVALLGTGSLIGRHGSRHPDRRGPEVRASRDTSEL